MKKNKILIVSIIILGVFYFVFSFMNDMGTHLSKLKKIKKEPVFYKELVKNESGLLYKKTMATDSVFPMSIYFYEKETKKYNLIMFRRKLSGDNPLEKLTFFDENKEKGVNKIYTHIIPSDKLEYSFDDQSNVTSLNFSIKDYKEDYVIKKTSNLLYLSFPLKETFAMSFNESQKPDLLSEINTNKNTEYNELLVLLKEDFVYVIYLKPFKEDYRGKRLTLVDLIKFDM